MWDRLRQSQVRARSSFTSRARVKPALDENASPSSDASLKLLCFLILLRFAFLGGALNIDAVWAGFLAKWAYHLSSVYFYLKKGLIVSNTTAMLIAHRRGKRTRSAARSRSFTKGEYSLLHGTNFAAAIN